MWVSPSSRSSVPRLGFREATLELIAPIDPETLLPMAFAARREFVEQFFDAALERRQNAIAEATERGDDAGLVPDLLTLIALHSDPAWVDRDLAVREALLLLSAGTSTSTDLLLNTLFDIHQWVRTRPDQAPSLATDSFVGAAVQEALRLHPAFEGALRMCISDTVLPSGTEVRAGQLAVLRIGIAGRDTARFGPDADEFNPDREVRLGTHRFGLGFNSGQHMCYGLPIVVANDGSDGSVGSVLKRLLERRVRPHPTLQPRPVYGRGNFRSFEVFPVLLG
jgi:cytochrome P450